MLGQFDYDRKGGGIGRRHNDERNSLSESIQIPGVAEVVCASCSAGTVGDFVFLLFPLLLAVIFFLFFAEEWAREDGFCEINIFVNGCVRIC